MIDDLPGAGESVVFLALQDEQSPAGFAQLYPVFSSVSMMKVWLLNDLFVDQSARGRGVGRALMDAVIAFARETGRGRIELETAVDNAVARRLYESLGFIRREGFDHYDLAIEAH